MAVKYRNLLWLFIMGSLIGVVLEGVYCQLLYGKWETHVASVWGPFCIIYGFGAVGYYIGAHYIRRKNIIIQFLVFTVIGTIVELLCGLVMRYGLTMRAWDYNTHFMNFLGLISPQMSLLWGAAGVVFVPLVPHIDRYFEKMQGNVWRIVGVVLSVFMAVNLSLTAFSIVRWKNRHNGIPPANRFSQALDIRYPDEYMENRFCEWSFIENA